ncbi:MAG: hypothetical protein KDA47_22990, partial [Planctomycetales bacterium]|nr:hypothetical protein [Planctomycetales bacterium]
MKLHLVRFALIAAIACAGPQFGKAANRASDDSAEAATQVELFQAIENGDIEVTMIPKDATQSTVLIKNNTKKPLSIKLPEVFAGVPVQAQFGGMGGMGGM